MAPGIWYVRSIFSQNGPLLTKAQTSFIKKINVRRTKHS